MKTSFARVASGLALLMAGTMVAPAAFAQSVQIYKYDALGRVILASSTTGGEDGYSYDPAGNRSAVNKFSLHLPVTADRLVSGDGLPVLGILTSPSGAYRLSMQSDGHLFVYVVSSGAGVWAGGAGTYQTAYVVMQSDGNLVMFDYKGASIWSSGTGGNPGATAFMQDDGKFVIKNAAGTIIWTT